MRITIVSRIFAPEPAAASQRLGVLADELAAQGDDVLVRTVRPPRDMAVSTAPRVRVSRWPVLRDRAGYVRGYLPYLSFDAPAFFRTLLSPRSDVVVVEPPPTTGFFQRIACALRRTPYVYYAADVWSLAAASTGASDLVLRVVRRMERFAMEGAAVCLAVSDGVAEEIARLAPRAHTEVVGHGVDETVFDPESTPLPGLAHAVYVGTASEWHGATIFVEALALARAAGHDVRIDFIGQGGEWALLQALADDLGVADLVTFAPSEPAARAARRLRAARVALCALRPRIGYDFAVPTKAYSAMSVGTPVLYAGPDPVRSLIAQERLGWSREYDAAAVADALVEATAADPDDATRSRIADWARRNVSAAAVARRCAAILHQIGESRSRGRTR
ncbi:glycosyltransferase [Microbacterium sp.]|uniref:glycosyltransferase n=1 Tax=Microbacterium sp. TaxID=51671 RepID=UPI003F711E99